MAITAWSANVLISSICFSVNGSTLSRRKLMAPTGTPSRSSGSARMAVAQLSGDGAAVRIRLRLGLEIRHMDWPPFHHGAPSDRGAHGGDYVPSGLNERA